MLLRRQKGCGDSGGEGIAELTDENTGVSVSLSEAVPEGVELYAGVMEAESLLEEKPELKEALDGLLSVYEISIRQNGEPVEIKDSAMTVRIPMNLPGGAGGRRAGAHRGKGRRRQPGL